MLFQQLSLQSSQTQPLVLRNNGSITSRIKLHIVGSPEAFHIYLQSGEIPGENLSTTLPLTLNLDPGQECECLVRFSPRMVKKYRGELRLNVEDNIFERQQILLIGEGYQDSVFITNIRGMADYRPTEVEEVGEDFEGKEIKGKSRNAKCIVCLSVLT